MSPHKISLNPNSLESRFTKGFLRSLLKINRENSKIPPCTPKEIFQRCDRVKTAADKSLASAVGPRRAWSRAVLLKIRNRSTRRQRWRRYALVRRINCHKVMSRSCLKKEKPAGEEEELAGYDQAQKLRKLVPGGETMDLCSLLDEAAHYVMCLNTQVQVMRCIADFCAT